MRGLASVLGVWLLTFPALVMLPWLGTAEPLGGLFVPPYIGVVDRRKGTILAADWVVA